MALIFAIEPDRQQAAQLTKLVRRHTGAELVLADTTERAIGAIGQRVPDLVLVPALLSPQDDAALAEALRAIAGAAHVQTLTIPILAAQTRKPSTSRMLSMLRRDQPVEASPGGCDPTVFAEQVVSYLKRAADEQLADVASVAEVAPGHAGAPVEIELSPLLNEEADDQPREEGGAALDPIPDHVGLALEAVEGDWINALNEHPLPPGASAPPRGGRSEWGELIESLRHDLDQINAERPIEHTPPAARGASAPSSPPLEGGPDEWGLFDPQPCGLPALLIKLDLLAEHQQSKTLRRAPIRNSSVR